MAHNQEAVSSNLTPATSRWKFPRQKQKITSFLRLLGVGFHKSDDYGFWQTNERILPAIFEELKDEVRSKLRELHPDTGGNAEEFRAFIDSWEQAKRGFALWGKKDLRLINAPEIEEQFRPKTAKKIKRAVELLKSGVSKSEAARETGSCTRTMRKLVGIGIGVVNKPLPSLPYNKTETYRIKNQANVKRWISNNRAKHNGYCKTWVARNRQRTRDKLKRWRKNNPEKYRAQRARQRARAKARREVSLTQVDTEILGMADLTVAANSVHASDLGAVVDGTSLEAIAAGDALYKDTAGKYGLADANGISPLYKVVGIALNTAPAADQPVQVCTADEDFDPGATLVVGTTYILSATPGKICPDADGVTGMRKQVIGIAKTAGVMKLRFSDSDTLIP